ncbi:MAG: serine hydrolase domain-containing protein [Pseudomonadota bacterium]
MITEMKSSIVKLALAFLTAAILTYSPAKAAPTQAQLDALSQEVNETLEASDTVGFAAAITDGETIIWSVEHGFLDEERAHRVTLDAPFRIGSITKTITAIAIFQLVEEGLVSLDDPISKHIDPSLYQNTWSDTHPITIAHLLEHTTGWDDLHFVEYLDYPADMTLEEGLAINPGSRVSRWPAGTVASYSNAGSSVAGRLIENVTGIPYADFIESRILSKLELKDSGFDLTLGKKLTSFQDPQTPFAFTNLWADSAGGLAMSARDLTRITNTFMQGGGSLISNASVKRMETPSTSLMAQRGVPSGFGPGLETRNRKGHLYRVHSGAIDGYNSEFGYLPTAGLGYVLFTNTADGDTFIEVSRAIRKTIENEAGPVTPRAIASLPDLDRVEGAYRAGSTRNGTFFLLDLLLGPQRVDKEGNTLTMTSYVFGDETALEPLGNGLFTENEGLTASHLLVGKPGEHVIMTTDGDALEQTSAIEALTPITLFALTVGAGVIALLVILGALVVRIFRSFSLKAFVRLWIWPALAGLSFVAFTVVLISALNDPIVNMQNLGKLSMLSGALWVTSLGLPLFALAGVWMVVRARTSSTLARGSVGLLLAVQLSFAALLASQGWLGFTSWSANIEPYSIGDTLAAL